MSSVPYTFANDNGDIQLYQLDANFSDVKAAVDTAILVTGSSQPAIRSVGTLNSLSVTGIVSAASVVSVNINANQGVFTTIVNAYSLTGG